MILKDVTQQFYAILHQVYNVSILHVNVLPVTIGIQQQMIQMVHVVSDLIFINSFQ